ncbi:bifunctional dTTP UTP pyrophosphatase methyltransferase [Octopus vulgaris]|uniref:Bifunctional dTTP UTP pyrophosphatase methyltransferase n=3 Tax=Octopus TaxID=6643 RepID=A0AA36BPB4_OCTVU|nr:probable bifunctional dTTP/UTP pyrophosphatase/methyltransferase protein isoform X2 [Octopus sinensis]CAI9737141.1 bifunctional dTTP UTP pyrophosphatase methyltransferase [Octopus vulgaris]
MLQPIITEINSLRIILASASPRRKQILENVGMSIEVVPSTFEENLEQSAFPTPADYAKATARGKAIEVARRLGVSEKQSGDSVKPPPDIVIGADTIITVGDKIYGKPKDREDAKNTLTQLSGKSHMAITGLVVVTPASWKVGKLFVEDNKPPLCVSECHEVTKVFMTDLAPEIMNSYLDSGEFNGRAGAYSIQGLAGSFIEAVDGDFYNVVGLPLHRFCRELLHICMTKQD